MKLKLLYNSVINIKKCNIQCKVLTRVFLKLINITEV